MKKSSRSVRVMMVAGEPSGDMHAAHVIRELRSRRKEIEIFGAGGPLMAKAGMEVRDDPTQKAIMGFVDVARNLPLLRRRFRDCWRWLREERPDVLVLVDYPGFNLRLASRAHALGIPVCYYIAPQVWAWHESRIKIMRRVIRKLLVINPFEKDYFKQQGIEAIYVGHPLMEEVPSKFPTRKSTLKKHEVPFSVFPLISAMPGSRPSEVVRIWPLYLETARMLRKLYPDLTLVVPQPMGLQASDYPGLEASDPVFFVHGPAYELRSACDVAWVKSGTGTLETALLRTPQAVIYKTSGFNAFLAKRFVNLSNYSLVNILAGKKVVTELMQEEAEPFRLAEETQKLLEDERIRQLQLKAVEAIRQDISVPAKASRNVAVEILKMLPPKI